MLLSSQGDDSGELRKISSIDRDNTTWTITGVKKYKPLWIVHGSYSGDSSTLLYIISGAGASQKGRYGLGNDNSNIVMVIPVSDTVIIRTGHNLEDDGDYLEAWQ